MEMYAEGYFSLPKQKTHLIKLLRIRRSDMTIRKLTNLSFPVFTGN